METNSEIQEFDHTTETPEISDCGINNPHYEIQPLLCE